jgi:hypothetical protein
MRFIYLSIILVFFLTNLRFTYSQQVYFSNTYNLCQNYENEAWSGADGIIQLEDGYVISGYSVDTVYFWWRRIPILKINYEGIPISFKSFGDTNADYYTGVSGSFLKKNDNQFYIAGVKEFWQPENYAVGYLMSFDSNFDTNWTKIYNLNKDLINDTNANFSQVAICSNQDLIFAGSMNGSHLLLLRTDSSGNTLWSKLFHYGSYSLCTGYSVIQTSDGGFALGGFQYTIGQPETGDPMIVKTDSLGNQQWVKYLGGNYEDNKAMLSQAKDGTIIMGSTYGEYMNGDVPISDINLVKLNNSGTVIWDKKYGSSIQYNYLLNVRALPNGDIIAVGKRPDVFPHYAGWILKVNENGDSLWYREYSYLNGEYSINHLSDVILSSDNGLIACGYVTPMAPDTGNRDAWVIKLDSIGCDSAGCDTTVEIKEQHGGLEVWRLGGLEIWPNPAREQIHVRLNRDELHGRWNMDDGRFNKDFILVIYDIFGQEVMKSKVFLQNRMTSLNISDLPSGFYLASCKDSRNRIYSVKFIVRK